MKVLEFENTQGILMRYSTATVLHRSAAFMMDIVLLGITMFLLEVTLTKVPTGIRYGLILAPIFFFYQLCMELFNDGRSVGKMALGLKVIRIDGRSPSGYDYLMRWMFRWVDIYMSSGAFAAMLVSATPKSQRIGDLLADTTVIHTKNLRIPLTQILKLNQLSSYKPEYAQASKLSEQQVLLAKETLQRAVRTKNDAHIQALNLVADRISLLFEIERPKNSRLFVQTVIKDYIALTR